MFFDIIKAADLV